MKRRIFIDVTRTAREKTHTGIQKVVRSTFRSLAREAGGAAEVIPVILDQTGAYPLRRLREHPYERNEPDGGRSHSAAKSLSLTIRAHWVERVHPYVSKQRAKPHMRALRWTLRRAIAAPRLLAQGVASLRRGQPVRFRPGDVLLLPDSAWSTNPWPVVERVKRAGGHIVTIWYDVIPITHPQFFSTSLAAAFKAYLEKSIANADRIICISRTVKAEVEQHARKRGLQPQVRHLYPIVAVADPPGQPRQDLAAAFEGRPSLLIVATVEPRKGHALLLDACDRLWGEGADFNLVVIGRVGWQVADLMGRFGRHPERGARLHLFHDATDGEVAYALNRASLMVFPSHAEGLGLPILEAEMAGCPTLCSDIPVFREIATSETRFFSPHEASALADALRPLIQPGALEATRRALKARKTVDSSSSYARELLSIIDGIGVPGTPVDIERRPATSDAASS